MNIATKHTTKRCKFCKTPIFIGCAYWSLGHSKYVCESCIDNAIVYLTFALSGYGLKILEKLK